MNERAHDLSKYRMSKAIDEFEVATMMYEGKKFTQSIPETCKPNRFLKPCLDDADFSCL